LAGIDGVERGCYGEVVASKFDCKLELNVGGDLLMSDIGYAFGEGCEGACECS
jgi:hypothetical protein